MPRRIRSYNPGRDTRWGTAHRRPTTRLVALGPAQEQADLAHMEATGERLPWRIYHTPLEDLAPDQVARICALVTEYPDYNQLRVHDSLTRWYVRAPAGFIDELPPVELPPVDEPR